MFNKLFSLFSHNIGIDLGTATTLVYVEKQGIVVNEPSVVALNQKTGQVVAVGNDAKNMLGRTPGHILAIRPLIEGVISDFEVTEEMITYLLNKAQKDHKKFLGPRVVVGVPSGITNVETRAVRDATRNAGAREVYIVEEPMAAAIGIRLPVMDPVGNMIIDIGGGTTEMAVISLAGIVFAKSIKVGGDEFDEAIITHLKKTYNLMIGERTAEEIKIKIGSAYPLEEEMTLEVKGRDILAGLPKTISVSSEEIREALSDPMQSILEAVRITLERTPPELSADLIDRGLVLAGGGSLLRGLDKLISEETGLPVHIAGDPLTAVALGTGRYLSDISLLKKLAVNSNHQTKFE